VRDLLVLGLAMAACSRSDPPASIARDSSGVTIVETPAAALTEAPVRVVADSPLFQIGSVDGPAEQQFAGIEAVRRLPDGRLAVADRGSAEIRFFDDRGHYVASHGRLGEAPGEYRYLVGLGSGPGDSLWAYDFGLRRLTVLTAAGAAVRTVSVGPVLAAPLAVGWLRSGDFVLQEQWSSALHAVTRTGLVRDSAAVALLAGDGVRLDTIVLVPGREVFIGSEDGRAVMSAPVLAHHAVVAMNDSLVFVGDQTTFEIRAYRASGTLARIVRITGVDLAIGPDERERAVDARASDAPEAERPMLRAHLNAMTAPATRPAYGPLAVDDAGNLWVGSYEVAGPARSWTVFDPDGRLRATVRVPPRFALRDVAGGVMVGTWRDALDVEYVRAYPVSGILPETPLGDHP